MTKEDLIKRIALLKRESDLTLSAYKGAIHEAEYWLKELDKPEESNENGSS